MLPSYALPLEMFLQPRPVLQKKELDGFFGARGSASDFFFLEPPVEPFFGFPPPDTAAALVVLFCFRA